MKKVWVVWCEYDIGQEGIAFSSEALAAHWAEKAIEAQKDNGLEETYQELLDGGLIGFNELEVDPQ